MDSADRKLAAFCRANGVPLDGARELLARFSMFAPYSDETAEIAGKLHDAGKTLREIGRELIEKYGVQPKSSRARSLHPQTVANLLKRAGRRQRAGK
jgi:hypothetical protein